MEEIYGWILTEHKGKLTIEYKEMMVILTEDFGYIDIIYEEPNLEENYERSCWEDSMDDYGYYAEDEALSVLSSYESLDDEEMEELMRFFVNGYEVEKQGDKMVFLLDEKIGNESEKAIEKIANLKISR